jgi:hypothetical protein
MQASRIVIAAVFFVIGALIAIPALTRGDTSSRASSSPATSASTTPTGTPSRSGAAAGQPSATPTRTARPRPTPTKTASTPVPTPTRTTRTPTATPTQTPTASASAVPLTVSIGRVQCPSRSVTVKVVNAGAQAADYTIRQDGTPTVADRVERGQSRTTKITLKENQSTKVAVVWNDRTIESTTRKANCTTPTPRETETPPGANLPRTGPASSATYAKVATGVAAMITGVIVFWYGGIWPRRREQIIRGKQ